MAHIDWWDLHVFQKDFLWWNQCVRLCFSGATLAGRWFDSPRSSNQGGIRKWWNTTHSCHMCCMATAHRMTRTKREAQMDKDVRFRIMWNHMDHSYTVNAVWCLQALVQNRETRPLQFLLHHSFSEFGRPNINPTLMRRSDVYMFINV